MAARTPKGKDKVEKVMHEFKEGKLQSSSGRKVRNPKQAIAIGLSEQRRKEGTEGRGSARKRPVARKTTKARAKTKTA